MIFIHQTPQEVELILAVVVTVAHRRGMPVTTVARQSSNDASPLRSSYQTVRGLYGRQKRLIGALLVVGEEISEALAFRFSELLRCDEFAESDNYSIAHMQSGKRPSN
jgi:precorrin-4 methylase